MDKYTLTVMGTSGIQRYIFGSNNLKHNVGASSLVHKVTHDWVYEKLIELGSTNVNEQGTIDETQTIESHDLNSELVYAGGGNAVILFRTPELAVQFTKGFTRKVLQVAPGLEVIVAHEESDWQDKKKPLPKVVQMAMDRLSQKKMDRVISSPMLGLGVTADCQFTGLPAVDKDEEERRISPEILAKVREADSAHEKLVKKLELPSGYDIPKDFDEFGRTRGESSYIAVVHTDGNGMGKRVQAIADSYTSSEQNREYIQAIREFSQSIQDAAEEALKSTVQQLIDSVDENRSIRGIIELPVRPEDGKGLLPFRPIVFGGDDVTFVCDGRLGLTLTEFYLRQFTSQDLASKLPKPPYARAGIAVVKTHYPFARAYALAGELARSAKNYIISQTDGEKDLTALDWHFAVGGLVLGLQEIRQREYTTEINGHPASLLMRPLRLGPPEGADWHSWQVFRDIIGEFTDHNGDWYGRRNKVKALWDALRDGPDATEQFLKLVGVDHIKEITQIQGVVHGWKGRECVCFDPIEAMDFFVPLEGEAE